MRLIDAEPLECVAHRTPEGVDAEGYMEGFRDALELMDKQPTIDAIPVIRCEDCKHMHAANLPDGQSWHYCPYMKFDVDPDFYCARGERR